MQAFAYAATALWMVGNLFLGLWALILSFKMENRRLPKQSPMPTWGRSKFAFQKDASDYSLARCRMGHADDAFFGFKRPGTPQPRIYLFRLVLDGGPQSQTFLLICGLCWRRHGDRRHHECTVLEGTINAVSPASVGSLFHFRCRPLAQMRSADCIP